MGGTLSLRERDASDIGMLISFRTNEPAEKHFRYGGDCMCRLSGHERSVDTVLKSATCCCTQRILFAVPQPESHQRGHRVRHRVRPSGLDENLRSAGSLGESRPQAAHRIDAARGLETAGRSHDPCLDSNSRNRFGPRRSIASESAQACSAAFESHRVWFVDAVDVCRATRRARCGVSIGGCERRRQSD